MVELIAVYSPPMPAPVRKRNRKKLAPFQEKAVRRGGQEIERERDEEELLAAEPVGENAEENSAENGAGEIAAAGEPNVAVGEMQRRARLQRTGDRTRERHFQPVENPGDAERDDDERVETAPSQALEARGDVGRDDAVCTVARLGKNGWNGHVAAPLAVIPYQRQALRSGCMCTAGAG